MNQAEMKNRIIAAFPNADTDGTFREVLKRYPDEIVSAYLAYRKKAYTADLMIVPTEELAEQLKPYAEPAGISVLVSDFIRVRDYKGAEFVSYPVLYNKYEEQEGKEPTIFFSVDREPLQEIPAGETLASVLPGKQTKGYLINHRFYTKEQLEEPLDCSWNEGAGCVTTIRTSDCMVQAALSEIRLLRERSCGTCTFCREGLYQIEETLAGMTKPGTALSQLDLMEEIGEAMRISGMCSVGRIAAEPALSAMHAFGDELRAHCGKGKCPAEKCGGFMSIYIDPHKCEGAGDCMDVCPENCIDGKRGFISMIDEFACTKCGACISACENGAVIQTSGRVPKLPERPTRVGRFRH